MIVVELEELGPGDLNAWPDLSQLLNHSPRIRWGQPGFWSKLRYFLPGLLTIVYLSILLSLFPTYTYIYVYFNVLLFHNAYI